jgi:FMNH2-dependent dimethyl sulfone monooxygenase
VTADHVGQGRFGLNIVSGWNPTEFGMFGVELKDHDDRYGYAEEWINIVKRIWSETEPFDHSGKYFDLKGVLAKPKPYGDSRPILVSAGNSEKGRDFAARSVDCLFTAIPKLEGIDEKIKVFQSFAPDGVRREVFASAHLMCRATRREAEEFHHYIVYEQGDWEAAEYAANYRGNRPNTWMRDEKDIKARLISGSGYPIIGSYDDAVETFLKMNAVGIDGLALGMINYVNDMPAIRDELLPRMERAGLRRARKPAREDRL